MQHIQVPFYITGFQPLQIWILHKDKRPFDVFFSMMPATFKTLKHQSGQYDVLQIMKKNAFLTCLYSMIYFFCNTFYCLGFIGSFLSVVYATTHINVSAFIHQRAKTQVRHQSFVKLIWINEGLELAFRIHKEQCKVHLQIMSTHS